MRLASRFGLTHSIRQERPLTNDELVKVVPSVFSEEKHNSRSDRYTYIPTITLLDKLREEGFQPFFACQSRVRDEDKRGHTKHMVRLRREGANKGTEVPEIILLNSHDGSSSYQMIPGMFRFVCTNGLVCGTWHCCKVSDEAAFCLIQRPYISKTLLTRRISPRGSP